MYEKQFNTIIRRAKKKGYSKEKTISAVKDLQLQAHMMWMLTPVTSPKSKGLAKDYRKAVQLESYARKNWKKIDKVI